MNLFLKNIVNNYDNYTYVTLLHKLGDISQSIHRLNFKYIYIYYFIRNNKNIVILYNKSNKIYRILCSNKDAVDWYSVDNTIDYKMYDIFNIKTIELCKCGNMDLDDIQYIDYVKNILDN
jgi:hypothetical protein